MDKKEIDISVKAPKDFKDIRGLMQEYELNDKYIKLARDGKTCLLGFCWETCGTLQSYETLDYRFGYIFAEALEMRNREIEKFLSKNI
jgi:hypothetical protein